MQLSILVQVDAFWIRSLKIGRRIQDNKKKTFLFWTHFGCSQIGDQGIEVSISGHGVLYLRSKCVLDFDA